MKIIITGACAVSARSVLRSLKVSDVFKNSEFIGWDMVDNLYGLFEGLFDKMYKVPSVSSVEYRTVINNILDFEKPDAVIVVPEVEVLYWSKEPFNVKFLTPPKEFCELAISKKKLFELLDGTEFIPKSSEVLTTTLNNMDYQPVLGFPIWMRDSSPGTASGKGSFLANNVEEMRAWAVINNGSTSFQLSEYLPGGNYGCFCLFKNGKLRKLAIAERITYIMSKVSISGITGNTSKGRLLNDDKIKAVALKVVDIVAKYTNTQMDGLVVVDLKADSSGVAKVTEINIRHVAFSSSFANAGFNLSEYHLLCTLDRENELTLDLEKDYPEGNLLLRDVDGRPIYVPNHKELKIGEYL